MKKALVTGCAGFIGSHLTRSLLADGWAVYGIDDLSTGSQANIDALRLEFGDRFICERTTVQGSNMLPTWAQCDVVFHLAARGSVPFSIENPQVSHDANVGGFFELLDFIRHMENRPRIVFASSSSVYGDVSSTIKSECDFGNPLSPYAATKQIKEIYGRTFAHCYGLEVVALRYFNVFGPGQRADSPYSAVIPKWAMAMLKGESITFNGRMYRARDFTPVAEVVRATRLAADVRMMKRGQFEAINVGCGHATSIETIFEILAQLTGYDMPPFYGPPRQSDVMDSRADTEKAEHFLGFKAVMNRQVLTERLKEVVASMKGDRNGPYRNRLADALNI